MNTLFFVNREEELKQVEESVKTLQDEQRLLRTPIIEFSGVQGIGKTTLLGQIQLLCEREEIPYITRKAEDVTDHDFTEVESLLKTSPVTMILDSLDSASSEQIQLIETRLGDLLENTRLFVVLASRDVKKFERTRSVARKLKIYPLEPLQREYSLSYLGKFAQTISPISPQAREIILDWTHGYPLAMKVMTDTILNEQLDPTKERDRRELLRILIQEVIEKRLLASASSSERTRLQTLLALLSIPRRFNLILMQDLIERFAPQYKLESSLAYITLPRAIGEVTSVLSWSMERAGYSIDASVRNLFLLQYKIEWPQQCAEIHKFLAEKNKDFAQQVTGSDRIRYLREFFYHLACSEDEARVRKNLEQQIGQLAQVKTPEERQSLESFVQFYEEFQQDQGLKEALGLQNSRAALSFVYKNFLKIYRRLPEKIRGNWLVEFFSPVTPQAKKEDFALIFEEAMRQIKQEVSREDAIKLYDELFQDKELEVLLGAKFEAVRKRIHAELVDEVAQSSEDD